MRTVQFPQSLQCVVDGLDVRGCADFGAFNFGAMLIEPRGEPVLPLPSVIAPR
jgi:hypothetical protein